MNFLASVIHISIVDGVWVVKYFDDDIIAALGTDKIITGISGDVQGEDMLKPVRALHPSADVSIVAHW